MPQNLPAIKIENLQKTYNAGKKKEVLAVNNLSFTIQPGEVVGFVGGNGAGKSTTIKSILGLVLPSSGTIEVFGHDAGTIPAAQAIGYLPEIASFHEFMAPLELLEIHADLAKVPKQEQKERCESILKRVELWERRNSPIKEFSKGMKQRFGLAQALIGDPPLLVLDELTSGLDPIAQHNLLELIQELSAEGKTILMSSHHMREIEFCCSRVIFIHQGEIRLEGTLQELLNPTGLFSIILEQELPKDIELNPDWDTKGTKIKVPKSDIDQALQVLNQHKINFLSIEPDKVSLEETFARISQ